MASVLGGVGMGVELIKRARLHRPHPKSYLTQNEVSEWLMTVVLLIIPRS